MGWKNVKEHYDIKHIVQVGVRREYGDEPCIMIGSLYINDIIVIRVSDAKILKRYTDGKGINEKLAVLQPRLDEDEKSGVLKSLIDEEDKFERLLPVYCIDDGRHIVKMWCEKYGWPNTTTGGKLMYNNIFYSQLRAAKYRLLSMSKMRWDIWWYNVRNKFSNIWRDIKGFKWSFEEIFDCVYVRLWGVFHVKNYGKEGKKA